LLTFSNETTGPVPLWLVTVPLVVGWFGRKLRRALSPVAARAALIPPSSGRGTVVRSLSGRP